MKKIVYTYDCETGEEITEEVEIEENEETLVPYINCSPNA